MKAVEAREGPSRGLHGAWLVQLQSSRRFVSSSTSEVELSFHAIPVYCFTATLTARWAPELCRLNLHPKIFSTECPVFWDLAPELTIFRNVFSTLGCRILPEH